MGVEAIGIVPIHLKSFAAPASGYHHGQEGQPRSVPEFTRGHYHGAG
jgi:hypothetical protein